ncbi:UxaA family hydrolase [Citrobacter portucalensis]|uniref:UxaA family hydrolase n=1 Tax=Citrobacter portucalensis TaxID=1639133 RepID=A0A9X4GMJ9_9ENTR|nr:UxaA family hydrolase [Citrobacter portucalensis]MDE9620426.1 UxaA family hydrolase [Citrobacter portucalensis]
MQMIKRALLLHKQDNCVVALEDIQSGDCIHYDGGEFSAISSVALGHKLAIEALNAGDKVRKYGAEIGSASQAIAIGEHIHSHNLSSDYIAVFHHDNAGYEPAGDA